jgi:hypothetical protein
MKKFWNIISAIIAIPMIIVLLVLLIPLIPFLILWAIIGDLQVRRVLKKKGCNVLFKPSGNKDFDEAIYQVTKESSALSLFEYSTTKNRLEKIIFSYFFIGKGPFLVIIQKDLQLDLKLDVAFKKYKAGNKVKLENILIKLKKFNHLLFEKDRSITRSDLNL